MPVPVRLPELGASNVRLSLWFAEVGDHVFEGDRLVEVILGAATFDVSAPVSGVLSHRFATVDAIVCAGQVLGVLEEDGEEGDP